MAGDTKKAMVNLVKSKILPKFNKTKTKASNAWKKIVSNYNKGPVGSWKKVLTKTQQKKLENVCGKARKKVFGKATDFAKGVILSILEVEAIECFLSVGGFVSAAIEYEVDGDLGDGKIVVKL